MSSTSGINAINLLVSAEPQEALDKANGSYAGHVAADPDYYKWQGEQQLVPLGMDGNPEQFAAGLHAALPAVNTLRLTFNAASFNPDGSLAPQFERFLTAAAAQGFNLILTYGDGETQGLGADGALTSQQIYDQLASSVHDRMVGAWGKMLDWTAAHGDVAAAVYGYEIANEPAAYKHGVEHATTGKIAAQQQFVALYASHMAEVASLIESHSSAKVLVDGWGFAGDFDPLATTQVGGVSTLDYLRGQIGDALVWSAHFYPGWGGAAAPGDRAGIESLYATTFAPLGSDDIIVTETNLQGDAANDYSTASQVVFAYARAQEWLGAHGIGVGWFAGAEAGKSNFVVVDAGGTLRFLHQDSYALGMNAFTLDDHNAAHAGAEALAAELIAGRLRNEVTDADYNAASPFDPVHYLGTAFGYDGNDTLTGSDQANNFLYGGAGNDSVTGSVNEDFLFGQAGNDILTGAAGNDRLYGGDGADTLHGGAGDDLMTGGAGADLFDAAAGSDVVADFHAGAGDRIAFGRGYTAWDQIAARATLVAANGATADDLLVHHDDGTTTLLLDVGTDLTAAAVDFTVATAPPVAVEMLVDAMRMTQGGDGNDMMVGSSLAETLNGGAGNDVIRATGGADRLFGGTGHDTLSSGWGASTLVGGAGNDRLEADVGHSGQQLIGGSGADTFVFTGLGGATATTSEVVDFTVGEDAVMVGADRVDLAHLPAGLSGETTAAGFLLHLDAHHDVLFDGLLL